MAEIQEAAARLPDAEKAELVLWLMELLPHSSGGDAEAESIEEADDRRRQLESGDVRLLSEPEFWAGIRAARAKCR